MDFWRPLLDKPIAVESNIRSTITVVKYWFKRIKEKGNSQWFIKIKKGYKIKIKKEHKMWEENSTKQKREKSK